MNVYSRILDLCKVSGDTMYSLAKHSGVSESVLSRLKTNSQGKLSKKNLILLANYFCVNEDWLETGIGKKESSGIVKDTLINDVALHERFIQIANKMYGDGDPDDISVDTNTMATYTGIPQERLWRIIYDNQFPAYTEIQSLLKADKKIDANWLLLGVGEMFRESLSQKDKERINTLVDTISALNETIGLKSEIIDALNLRIKQLENQLNSK